MRSKITEYKKKKVIELINRMDDVEIEKLSRQLKIGINESTASAAGGGAMSSVS